jgi:hypothetical protein
MTKGWGFTGCLFLIVFFFPLTLFAEKSGATLKELIGDLPTFYRTLVKRVPVVVDTADYEKNIRAQLGKQGLSPVTVDKILKARLPDYVADYIDTIGEIASEPGGNFMNDIVGRLNLPDFTFEKKITSNGHGDWENPDVDAVSELLGGVNGVAVIVAHWTKVSRLGAYLNTEAQDTLVGAQFKDSFKHEGKVLNLEFAWRTKIQNADFYLAEGLKKIFGSEQIVLLQKEKLSAGGAYVRSILAHEFRHYLDAVNPPAECAKAARQKEGDRLQALWDTEITPKLDAWYAEYVASEAYQKYFAAALIRAQKKLARLPEEKRAAEMTQFLKDEYDEAVMERFVYLYSAIEFRGFREQVQYLKRQEKLAEAHVLNMITGTNRAVVDAAPVVELASGEKIPYVRPSLPLDRFYITSHYRNL